MKRKNERRCSDCLPVSGVFDICESGLEDKYATQVMWKAIGFALTCILLGVALATGLTFLGGRL